MIKILLCLFLYSTVSFSMTKVVVIDDFSTDKSHGYLVSQNLLKYAGKLKYDPDIVELNINGHLSFSELVDIAISIDAKVINLSFGVMPLGAHEFNQEEYSILKKASDKGIWIVVAGGNDGKELSLKKNPVYPCMYKIENLICVGAESEGKVWKESNYGGWIYLYANGQFGSLIGTSFATPKISQAIALFYENNKSSRFSKDIILPAIDKKSFFNLEKFEFYVQFEKSLALSYVKGPL